MITLSKWFHHGIQMYWWKFNKPTSRTFCWPFVGILLANLSTLSSVPCRSSKILQYEGWRIRTSLRCLEILFGLLVESPVVVASPDEVTLESKASLLPTTTYWKSIKTKYCISHILGTFWFLFLFYNIHFYFTFVVWLEPLFDEDPFVTDDVVTVIEGATRDL